MKRRIIASNAVPASTGINTSKVKLPKDGRKIKDGARIYLIEDLDFGYFDQISRPEYFRYSKELANYAEEEGWLYNGNDEDGEFVGVKIPRGTTLRYTGHSYHPNLEYTFELPFCQRCLVLPSYYYEDLADAAVTQANNIKEN